MSNSDLQELVDSPNETLQSEYKEWLTLSSDSIARASTARHMAALCNYGGGYMVFGFSDVLIPVSSGEIDPTTYSRDLFASIAKKYLEPSIQCDVQLVRSRLGNVHAVVTVPSHGAVPVCAKAGGPEVGGRPQGIVSGTYYVRKTGPESAPILTASEWHPIIRRCAMHERSTILAALGAALQGPSATIDPTTRLGEWHEAARRAYDIELGRHSLPAEIRLSNEQLSYSIDRPEHESVDAADLIRVAREMNFEIRDRVNTGWSMFYPFEREQIAPFVNVDPTSGQGTEEFIEANLMRDDGPSPHSAEMWRLSTDGKATIIRPHRLDYPITAPPGWTVGKLFSPNLLIQDIGELVRHAQAFSERFSTPTQVGFRCEFRGLLGRELGHPGRDWREGRVAKSDNRIVTQTWPVTSLPTQWPEIVANLAAPVLRAFDPSIRCTADWVSHEAKGWRPIGSQYP